MNCLLKPYSFVVLITEVLNLIGLNLCDYPFRYNREQYLALEPSPS
jgi:hypothetical protein